MLTLRRSTLMIGYCAMWLVSGCASQTPQPALIAQQSDESLATLNAAASTLLNGRKVRLSKTAFTNYPKLSVVPGRSNTPKGRLASGRIIIPPDELRLVRVGRRCELMHVATQERASLSGVECIAITPAK